MPDERWRFTPNGWIVRRRTREIEKTLRETNREAFQFKPYIRGPPRRDHGIGPDWSFIVRVCPGGVSVRATQNINGSELRIKFSRESGAGPGCVAEVCERVRALDWSAISIGPPAEWPNALKVLAPIVFTANQPMFLIWGPDRIFLYNDAFVPLAGGKHPTSLGQPSHQVWEEDWAEIGPLLDRVFAGEAAHMIRFKTPLGREGRIEDATFDFSVTPVRPNQGAVEGLFCVCVKTIKMARREVSQLKNAQRARDRIFEMSRDLFAVATFDGYLKSINPAWAHQLGRTSDELLAIPFFEIIHPDDLAATGDVLARLKRGESVHQFLVRLVKADGSAISFAWSATSEGADPGTFFTVGRDITEDQRRDDALLQRQKMEAVGQLTGGLAHDFNNLLQAVHGNLDLIRRRPEDTARVVRLSENGLKVAERAAKLTAQLLAFSRAQKLEMRSLSIASVIAASEEIIRRSIGPQVRVSVSIDGENLGALGDPTQLELSLLNLAINARDAMPNGGILTIAVRETTLSNDPELKDGRYVEIRVSDTGHGMVPAVAAKAFDPFFTTKGVGKGTGLGLSQVYGMARQAGGVARIESRPSHGTTVVLLLKAADVSTRNTISTGINNSASLVLDQLTVLVVDDDPDVRQFLTDSLEGLGYRVISAEDGQKCLSALKTTTPDVVLLDFAMPGMNGAEVADRIRADHPDLLVVFASGYSDSAAIIESIGPSATVLKKPFRIDDLDSALRKAVRSNSERR